MTSAIRPLSAVRPPAVRHLSAVRHPSARRPQSVRCMSVFRPLSVRHPSVVARLSAHCLFAVCPSAVRPPLVQLSNRYIYIDRCIYVYIYRYEQRVCARCPDSL